MSRIENGQIQKDVLGMEQQNVPAVLRDRAGRVRWTLPGNTPEENEQLGIRNTQGLFLERFPEFSELFPVDEDGEIAEDKMEEAKRFTLDRLGSSRKFAKSIGNVPVKRTAFYFEGSHIVAIQKSFQPWGIEFGESIGKQRRETNPNHHTLKHSSSQKIIVEIEQSARQFTLEGNRLSQRNLRNHGMGWLVKAIERYYPGHLSALQRKLLVWGESGRRDRRPKYFWAPENTREEALKIYQREGKLTHVLLKTLNRKDLSKAIERYPGGITQLKTDIKVPDDNNVNRNINRHNRGYWTTESIEREAQEFYQYVGRLYPALLRAKGKFGLVYAIQQHYSGGMMALKEKLGIYSLKPEATISPDQANEELMKFLEVRDE